MRFAFTFKIIFMGIFIAFSQQYLVNMFIIRFMFAKYLFIYHLNRDKIFLYKLLNTDIMPFGIYFSSIIYVLIYCQSIHIIPFFIKFAAKLIIISHTTKLFPIFFISHQ